MEGRLRTELLKFYSVSLRLVIADFEFVVLCSYMEEFFFLGNSLNSYNLKEAGSCFLMSLLGRLALGLVTYLLLFA